MSKFLEDMVKSSKISLDLQFIEVILISVSVIILLLTFVFRFAVVDGSSMNNTLNDNDIVLITNYPNFSGVFKDFELSQGDIVAIAPDNEMQKVKGAFIKRVIAVEGQTIGFDTEKGEIYIDGKKIKEPYISTKTLVGVEWDIPDKIPQNKVFVMGDNRAVSTDSRSTRIQLIDKSNIIGKAQCIIYPPNRLSYLY